MTKIVIYLYAEIFDLRADVGKIYECFQRYFNKQVQHMINNSRQLHLQLQSMVWQWCLCCTDSIAINITI